MTGVKDRAVWARRMLLASVATTAVAFLAEIDAYRQPLDASVLFRAIGLAQIVVYFITAVVFIRWFRAAYAELPALRVRQDHKQWWTIGGWLIPIMNFFRPKQIADEIWLAGHRHGFVVPTYVDVWWGMFITSWLVGNGAGRLYGAADSAAEIRLALWGYFLSDAADVIAALLAYRLVGDSTEGLERTARDQKPPEQPVPALAPA